MIIGTPMDADVRTTFLLGALTLVLAMAVDVSRGLFGPPVTTFVGSIPAYAIGAFALGEFIVFLLFFRGALQLERHARNGVLAATALVLLAVTSAAIHFLLVAPVVGLWYFADTKEQYGPKASWTPAAWASGGLSLVFAFVAVTGGDAILFTLGTGAAIVASIGLFAASTDIAEIVQVAGDALAERVPVRRFPWLGALAVCASAAVPFAAGTLQTKPTPDIVGIGAGFVFVYALIYWMIVAIGRKRKLAIEPHVPYGSLLAIVAVFGLTFEAATITQYVRNPVAFDAAKVFTSFDLHSAANWLFMGFVIALAVLGRRSAAIFSFLGYGAIVGTWWFHNFSQRDVTLLAVPFGVAISTPIVLVVVAIWPKTRDRFAAICGLLVATNLGIAFYAVVAYLFLVPTARLEDGSLLQAIVVLAALAWDMITSRNVTLSHSARLPRNARVSFFIAYLSLVALLVMLSSASDLHRPHAMEHVFDSEWYVGTGLQLFGAPLLLFVFALRMRAILTGPPSPEALPAPLP